MLSLSLSVALPFSSPGLHGNTSTHKETVSIFYLSLFDPHWYRYTGIFFSPSPSSLLSFFHFDSLRHLAEEIFLSVSLSFLLFSSLGNSTSYRRWRLTTGDLRVLLTLPRVPRNEHLGDKGTRERERARRKHKEGRERVWIRAEKRKQRIEGLAEGEGGKETERGKG